MEYRNLGKKVLGQALKNTKNIDIFEKNIFHVTDDEETYKTVLYQTIGDLLSGNKVKDVLELIKNKKIIWKHPSYQEFQNRLDEQNKFIEHPFEVVEGVLTCGKCKGNRVHYYQRQLRSSDEPMTTFATCVACNNKWKYDG